MFKSHECKRGQETLSQSVNFFFSLGSASLPAFIMHPLSVA